MFFNNFAKKVNILDVSAIVIILLMASVFQLLLHELPCPLCLLQRIGLLLMSVGFLMNLKFGVRPSHYAISILSAIFTASVAMRQILLHIVPGTGSYGDPFLGLHLYSWVFVVTVLFIIFTVIQILFADNAQLKVSSGLNSLIQVIFALVLIVAAMNIISTYLECGLAPCPDNPTHYLH